MGPLHLLGVMALVISVIIRIRCLREGGHMKKDRFTKIMDKVTWIFVIGGILLICVSVYPRMKEFIDYKKQVAFYDELVQNHKEMRATNNTDSKLLSDTSMPMPTPEEEPSILANMAPLLESNEETIGWITIPNTAINYPLVQHTDNQYYLEYNSANEPSAYGSIYIDYRNDKRLIDRNTLIYGHNMNNGTMFHELVKYKERDFFKQHPYIYMSNLYETFTYEIFAVYVVDADVETVEVVYESDEAFMNYIQDCQTRSIWPRSIELEATDQIITLVTCSYELDNARTLVQAKLIK